MNFHLVLLGIGLSFSNFTHAQESGATNLEWARFHQNPRAYMNEVPIKGGSSVSRPGATSTEKFAARLERWPQLKRPKYFSGESGSRRKVQSFFNLREFSARGLKPIFNLEELENASLTQASTSTQPWSGSYWPIYEGGLASRYASPDHYDGDATWKTFHENMMRAGSLAEIAARSVPSELDDLSPAEKYDLLIGGSDQLRKSKYGFLTRTMWKEGEAYANHDGRVETWMGYCHGWAPAALIEKRPTQVTSAVSQDGQRLRFYPSDLKGLTTLLWAKGDYSHRFLGGRCGAKRPQTDPETGRILDSDCFDVNPGIWHLVMTNQIGQLGRGLVIDATYDYEVWNQPVFSYRYKYFNPETGAQSQYVKEALVRTSDYSKDRFKQYRPVETAFVVGIEMTIDYTAETTANHAESDSDKQDSTRTVTYVYDLELNHLGEIIGGEWYRNAHPDFMWVPDSDSRPVSEGDIKIAYEPAWQLDQPLPQFWRDIAIRTAIVTGSPLAKIIDPLIGEAAKQ